MLRSGIIRLSLLLLFTGFVTSAQPLPPDPSTRSAEIAAGSRSSVDLDGQGNIVATELNRDIRSVAIGPRDVTLGKGKFRGEALTWFYTASTFATGKGQSFLTRTLTHYWEICARLTGYHVNGTSAAPNYLTCLTTNQPAVYAITSEYNGWSGCAIMNFALVTRFAKTDTYHIFRRADGLKVHAAPTSATLYYGCFGDVP
ncbi:MAG: hypothetical protein UZ13_03663 [Chloroflexi bacterium OLB13]|nr:MAG: hypothetical protein UZ13_03663 [Chloroflexi bacterium OLB13]